MLTEHRKGGKRELQSPKPYSPTLNYQHPYTCSSRSATLEGVFFRGPAAISYIQAFRVWRVLRFV